MPICPKCPSFWDSNVCDPAFVRDPYCLIRSLAVLQTVSCDSIPDFSASRQQYCLLAGLFRSMSFMFSIVTSQEHFRLMEKKSFRQQQQQQVYLSSTNTFYA